MFAMTLEQLAEAQRKGLQALIEEAGSVAHLARMIGYGYDTVRGWEQRGRISESGALAVAGHPTLGPLFPAIKLRPDFKA